MRLDWREFVATGGYVLLVPTAFRADQAGERATLLAILLALAYLAFMLSLNRLRAIRDTPTSRVASAAQGYVELAGKGRALPDRTVYSPAHHLPCLWYRYRAYVREGDKWRQTESGQSDEVFLLDDGTGRCLIDPEGAEIFSSRKETYTYGDSRVVEELLLAEDTLYALGEFTSHGGGHTRFDDREEVGNILAEWKEDQEALHRRFDLDGNGTIDPQEWQLARQAANREMQSRKLAAMNTPVDHQLSRPRSGRPFLVANFQPDPLAKRYRNRTWVHGAVTLASLVWLGLSLGGL